MFVCLLIASLISSFIHSSIRIFVYFLWILWINQSFIHSLANRFHCSIRRSIHSCIHWFIFIFINSFVCIDLYIHWFVCIAIDSFIIDSLNHFFIYSCINLFIHSIIHSLIHYKLSQVVLVWKSITIAFSTSGLHARSHNSSHRLSLPFGLVSNMNKHWKQLSIKRSTKPSSVCLGNRHLNLHRDSLIRDITFPFFVTEKSVFKCWQVCKPACHSS